MTDRANQRRMLALAAVTFAALLILASKIISLHAGAYAERIQNTMVRRRFELELNAERGKIYDRNGNLLALDVAKKTVWADPSIVVEHGSEAKSAAFLADCMGLVPEELLNQLGNAKRRFAYVGGYGVTIESEQSDLIKSKKLPGIFLKDIYVRSYPRGSSLSHVLGYVNLDGQGSAGVEQTWNKKMLGIPGLIVSELDGKRNEIYNRRSVEINPRAGADVILTLDQSIQYITEQALAKTVEEHNAIAAWAIVQRVKTGEILAMANFPDYNPNNFRGTDPNHMRNRCIADIYEPGSTFKVAIIAGALNEGIITPSEIFDCENGLWMYERRPLRDYRPYGKLSVADIIKKSSNIGTAKIALLLGNEKMHEYIQAFGIGQTTGIKLPGEEAGIFRPVNMWSRLSPTRIAMGHEVAVTALHIVNMMSAVANDGVMMKPYIVKKVTTSDGTLLFEEEPSVLSRPISRQTAKLMRELLVRTTEDGGTARRAIVPGYTVGGKTGTSQKAIPGGYSDKLNIASFVGFLPAEDPELTIIVVVDAPIKTVRTGGAVAAPVFAEIAEQTTRYLNIPTSSTLNSSSQGSHVSHGTEGAPKSSRL